MFHLRHVDDLYWRLNAWRPLTYVTMYALSVAGITLHNLQNKASLSTTCILKIQYPEIKQVAT